MKFNAGVVRNTEEWITENGLIDNGGAKLCDFLKFIGIDKRCFYRWMKDKPEFKDAVENGKAEFKSRLKTDLVASLAKVAKGYEVEEVEREFKPNPQDPNKPIQTKLKKKKVNYQPNVGAAIFLLTNLDPENWQNRQKGDFIIRDKDDKKMTIDEINEEIDRLKKIQGNEE